LMPALATVREQANQTKCLAQLRNIALAGVMHAQEHDGYLPPAGWLWHCKMCDPQGLDDKAQRRYMYYDDAGGKRPLPVTVALGIYMGSTCRTDSREHLVEDMAGEFQRKLFRCPSQTFDYHGWTVRGGDDGSYTGPDEYSSYSFNEALLGRRDYTLNCPRGMLSRVGRSSEVFLAIDARPRDKDVHRVFLIPENDTDQTLYDVQQSLLGEPDRGREALDFTRHRMRINAAFCDGHAATFPMGLPPNGGDGLKSILVSKGIHY
jgi:prepilin-type processing-associated H-X9-DG protein